MVTATALSNYQLGDLLGRGASGSVYRALNFLTGETVAIKSISLLTLSPTLLPDIMSEIDLLKNLNHPNIVKYKGFARDKESLFIVLEYCENGSLQSIVKKFGKFPESLVAVYISQVLEGLVYLHEQGVIHRDIKGANILTNKDGSVKLADFGVSSRAPPTLVSKSISSGGTASDDLESSHGGDGRGNKIGGRGRNNDVVAKEDNEVVGSPYWMAPEVIEQSGASTASDIWSVGCVVVELLEGKPPYGDLAPMQALWRIVQDDSMRIPEGASPIVKDFLYHCFQKDPNLRVSAKKLLRHPWMQSARKTLDTTPSNATQHKAPRATTSASTLAPTPISNSAPSATPSLHSASYPTAAASTAPSSLTAPSTGRGTMPGPRTLRALTPVNEGKSGSGSGQEKKSEDGTSAGVKQPMTVYDEAVQRVQQWNEALNASPKAMGSTKRILSTAQGTARRLSNNQPRTTTSGLSSAASLFAIQALPSRSSGDRDRSVSSSSIGNGNGVAQLDSGINLASTSTQHLQSHANSLLMGQGGRGGGGSGLMQKNLHVSDVLNRARECGDTEERWDDDFASDITLSKFGHRKTQTTMSEDPDQQTLRPAKSPVMVKPINFNQYDAPRSLPTNTSQPTILVLGKNNSTDSSRSSSAGSSYPVPVPKGSIQDDDYSDLAAEEDDLEAKLANLKLLNKGRRRLMHPDDLRKIGTLIPAPSSISRPALPTTPGQPSSTPIKSSPPTTAVISSTNTVVDMMQTSGTTSPSLGVSVIPRNVTTSRSPPGSRQSSVKGNRQEVSDSPLELDKYTEKDDEDYSDIFDGSATQHFSTGDTKSSQSFHLTKRSNRSWHDDDDTIGEDDSQDPFAEINDDFDTEDDIEANILRDKRATLCANVNKVVDQLSVDTPQSILKDASDELLDMFENAPDMGLENHFVANHGMLAILDVLEARLSRDVAVRLLRITNHIVSLDVENLESFCLVGGIPVIIPYTSKRQSLDTRLEASLFIQYLTRSALTLQMFISCRGLKVLVELLDEDYTVNKTLILSSLEGIGSVFELQSPTPKPDFCRMFVREGILDPLSTAFLAFLRDPQIKDEEIHKRAVDVLLLFCQVAQADARVREAFAARTIMIRLLKALDLLPRKLLITAIKAVKHLSTSPQLIEVLQNSNAMEVLVSLLGKTIKGSYSNEICSHLFQTIYSMCKLSKARQEEAASSGIIPLLKRVIQNKSPLKQFALPILCDLANAGKISRRLLWQNEGLGLYLNLLDDPYWRISALEAILAWMQDETARVEDVLIDKSASEKLVKCFVQSTSVSFEGILDPLLKILRLSPALTSSISSTPFFRRLSDSLERQTRAVTKLNLLRITRVVCETHPDRATLVSRFSLASIVDKLARQDDAILVRELAKEIYPTLLFGNTPTPVGGASGGGGLGDSIAPGNGEVDGGENGSRDRRNEVDRGGDAVGPVVPSRGVTVNNPLSTNRRKSTTIRRSTSESTVPFSIRAPSAMTVGTSAAVGKVGTAMSRGQGAVTSPSTPVLKPDTEQRHKRKISRSQLRDVKWETDENGILKSVRAPSKST